MARNGAISPWAATFGEYALIQRCRVHKRRNVLDHLPERERTFTGRKPDRGDDLRWAEGDWKR